MSKLNYTPEQEGIIKSKAEIIKVKAFAGSGKTSTLEGFSLARPKDSILYVAFSKAVQLAAAKRFPRNVTVKTSHSIAYAGVGHRFQNKLSASLRSFDLMRELELDRRRGAPPKARQALFMNRIMEGVNRFIASSDHEIDFEHLQFLDTPVERSFDRMLAFKMMREIWDGMCDENNPRIQMTHDGYLKLFMVMGGAFGKYDVTLLDEAQDSSPTTLQLFMGQSGQKVMVGDQHQSIFQFRGAINAMEEVDADEEHALTRSFRFGSNIARVANQILHLKNEPRVLQGSGRDDTVGTVNRTNQYMYLSRGNAHLVEVAHAALNRNEAIHFIGGPEGYRLNLIKDAYNLKCGRTSDVKDPFIRSFVDFDDFTAFGEDSKDPEISILVKTVNMMKGVDLNRLVDRIMEVHTKDPKDAHVLLSTGHKSKGLEHEQVILAGNFQVHSEDRDDKKSKEKQVVLNELPDGGTRFPALEEEINLSYVAATRAISVLETPLVPELTVYNSAVHNKEVAMPLYDLKVDPKTVAGVKPKPKFRL